MPHALIQFTNVSVRFRAKRTENNCRRLELFVIDDGDPCTGRHVFVKIPQEAIEIFMEIAVKRTVQKIRSREAVRTLALNVDTFFDDLLQPD